MLKHAHNACMDKSTKQAIKLKSRKLSYKDHTQKKDRNRNLLLEWHEWVREVWLS